MLFDRFTNKSNSSAVNGNICIDDATLNSLGFEGGSLRTTSTNWSYTGGGTLQMEGAFFGLDASETGGGFDLTSDDVDMTGVFIEKER